MTEFSTEQVFELLVESNLSFIEYTADSNYDRRDWLMFDINRKLDSNQIEKLHEVGDLRFFGKGYIAIRFYDDDMRDRFSKDALNTDTTEDSREVKKDE